MAALPGKADAAASNTSSGDASDIADILGGAAGNDLDRVQTAQALLDECHWIHRTCERGSSSCSRQQQTSSTLLPKLKPEGAGAEARPQKDYMKASPGMPTLLCALACPIQKASSSVCRQTRYTKLDCTTLATEKRSRGQCLPAAAGALR